MPLVGGHVENEPLIKDEYLATENRILNSQLKKPVQFNDSERIPFAKIGKRMGLKALREVGCIVQPETIMNWFRRSAA